VNFSDKYSLNSISGPEKAYQNSIPALLNAAKRQTEFFQSGILRNYIVIISMTLVVLIWLMAFNGGGLSILSLDGLTKLKWFEIVFVVLMLVGLVNTLITTSRLTAIVSLGMVGYGTAAIFLYYGGPDVAMTQFLIETLTIVLFVLVLNKLPKFVVVRKGLLVRIAFPAVAFGATMTIILMWVQSLQVASPLKDYFAQNSYLLAKGKNVVNVILVDFRGLDTLGEISVSAIASIGIFTLLKVTQSKQ